MRLIVAFVAVALFAAGCGSAADKNEYVNSVNQAQASLTTSLSSIGDVGSGEPAAVASKLQEGGKAIDKAADDFNNIEPPDDAKTAHTQIVAGLHSLADTFRQAAEAAKAKDTQKLVSILSGIQASKGAKELEAAQKELQANGYKFKS
jgi:hypothetical protein